MRRRKGLSQGTKGFVNSKYGNRSMNVDGFSFQSTLEAARWIELRVMERRGEISGLRRQVQFPVRGPDGKKVAVYYADFVYQRDGGQVVEDTKGFLVSDGFKMKQALLKADGVDVIVVKRPQVARFALDTARQIRDFGVEYKT